MRLWQDLKVPKNQKGPSWKSKYYPFGCHFSGFASGEPLPDKCYILPKHLSCSALRGPALVFAHIKRNP
jgi:hypothetical protein